MKIIALISVYCYALFTPLNSATWGQNGHRIVAQIAYDNLSDNAKTEVDKILGDEYLAQIATWPDYIRSEKKWDFAKTWHFMTVNPGETAADVIEKNGKTDKIDDAADAIKLMQRVLQDDNEAIKQLTALMEKNKVQPLNGSVKTTALAFFIHFMGDIHQPMHVGKNKDLGGNKIIVMFFSERSKLHSVWDSGIIEQEGLGFRAFADFVDKHTATNKTRWQKSKLEEWAQESVDHREKIYNTLYDNTDRDSGLPNMSYQYQHDFLPVVEARLGAAGYRAAGCLNDIFK